MQANSDSHRSSGLVPTTGSKERSGELYEDVGLRTKESEVVALDRGRQQASWTDS